MVPSVSNVVIAAIGWGLAVPGLAAEEGTLPGIGSAYEEWAPRSASSFLPPAFLKSDHHRVDDVVVTELYQDHFRVESDFGTYKVSGDAMLRRTVREIHALATMAEITRTEAFADAAGEALKKPFVAAKNLVTHPADTISGVPGGIGHLFTSVEETIEGEESEYEDSEVEGMLTVSKFKRHYASDLGIDVYTSNKKVQEELNRIGWASAVGNLAPGLLTAPVSAPAIMLAKGFSWVDTFNDILKEKPPGVLRHEDEQMLQAMGIAPDLAQRFLDHPSYSPRHETVLVRSLAALEGAAGREHLISAALRAENEEAALFFQQVAEILAGYQRGDSAIASLHPWRNQVAARTKKGHLLLPMPIDYGRWTRVSAPLLRKVATHPPDDAEPGTIELWVTGTVSPKLREEAIRLGIAVTENVDQKIGMVD